jgi:DNA-binding PadR family transcriptional regulator
MHHHGHYGRHDESRSEHWGAGRHRRGRFGGLVSADGTAWARGGMDPDDMRAGRMLAQGDLRLIALSFIAEEPRHGYEIIKLVEEKTADWYSPSPGIVYPTLTYLEEAGYVTASTEGAKKLYAITEEGRAYLKANRDVVDVVLARLSALGERVSRWRRDRAASATAAARCRRWSKPPSIICANRRQAARRRRRSRSASGRNPRPHRDGIAAEITLIRVITRLAAVPISPTRPACARARAGCRCPSAGPECGAGPETSEQLEQQRRLRPLLARQHAADQPLLDGELHPLRETHRQAYAAFDGLEIASSPAGLQRRRQPVGGGDRILHRHVDADTADRRHRMRGIADAQQTRPPPFFSRSTATLKSLMSSQLFSWPMRSARNGDISTTPSRNASSPVALTSSIPPLG